MIKINNQYNNRKKSAVSEVFGTIMLLLISVSIFSTVYAAFFTVDVPPPQPSVTLVASIDDEFNLIISHRGGESLGMDIFTILSLSDGTNNNFNMVDHLDDDNSNSLWDINEKVSFDLSLLPIDIQFDPIDVSVVDPESNSVIMRGTVQQKRISDLSMSLVYEGPVIPQPGEIIRVRYIITNNGPNSAEDVNILIKVPFESLSKVDEGGDIVFVSNSDSHLWNIDLIEDGQSLEHWVDYEVINGNYLKTQLAIVIDGSNSITSWWSSALSGLADAISNGIIPHNNQVEFMVIQYGGNLYQFPRPYARTEIKPTVIDSDNYLDIAHDIRYLTQMGGTASPMACGFNLARYELEHTKRDPSKTRQIINLITASNPHCMCDDYDDGYVIGNPTEDEKIIQGQTSAVMAVENLIKILGLREGQDEIDSEAVFSGTEPDIGVYWLEKKIVFPGYNEWLQSQSKPDRPGWVRQIHTEDELTQSINEIFDITLNSIVIRAEITSTHHNDPDPSNNIAELIIMPETDSITRG